MEHWIQQIDENTKQFKESFSRLNDEQFNWKPRPDSWSIAQNIDHLIIINSSYFPILEQLRAGQYQVPWHGKLGFVVSFMGNMVLKAVSPDRRSKMQTFPLWEPTQSRVETGILDRFVQHQGDLKEAIRSCAALLSGGAVISSPANRNIVYTLETAFEVIVSHERRHLMQAREVLEVLPEGYAI